MSRVCTDPAQMALFAESRNEEAFRRFHHDNPHVLGLVLAEARKAKSAGLASCGIDLIWGRMRWLLTVETRAADGWKLNNTHAAYFARLAMHRAPDLAGFFETRRQEHHFDPASVVDRAAVA